MSQILRSTGILTVTVAVTQDESEAFQPAMVRALREVAAAHEGDDAVGAHGTMPVDNGQATWSFQSASHAEPSDVRAMRMVEEAPGQFRLVPELAPPRGERKKA